MHTHLPLCCNPYRTSSFAPARANTRRFKWISYGSWSNTQSAFKYLTVEPKSVEFGD